MNSAGETSLCLSVSVCLRNRIITTVPGGRECSAEAVRATALKAEREFVREKRASEVRQVNGLNKGVGVE